MSAPFCPYSEPPLTKFQTLFTRCICINYNKNIDESFYLLFILKLEENI